MTGGLLNLLRPELFQGARQKPPYFEGWYYRLQDAQGDIYALIPGICLGGRPHSFLQVLDSRAGRVFYFRYPARDFTYAPDRLRIRAGGSVFERDAVFLNEASVRGQVLFTNPVPFSRRAFSPGIMGPFAFLPGLECRHAVITVKSGLEGSIEFCGRSVCFDGGTGYIEKDWGSAFPQNYIWAYAGRFAHSDAAFMASVASVPVWGRVINGVIAFLYLRGRILRFATYTGARVTRLEQEHGEIFLEIASFGQSLRLSLFPGLTVRLVGPTPAGMDREIGECFGGRLNLKVFSKDGSLLFEDESRSAGFELCGDIFSLV